MTVEIAGHAQKVKTAGHVQIEDLVLRDQKVKIVDLVLKDKTVDRVLKEDLVQTADRVRLDLKARTVDLDLKVKIVRLDRLVQKDKNADLVLKDKIVRKEVFQHQMVERPHLNHSRRKRNSNQDLREMVQRLPLKLSLGFIFLLELLFFACSDSGVVIDESHNFPTSGWIQKQPMHFNVRIPVDSASYALYVVVRQNNAYPFYNLYFSPSILDESGKTLQRGLAEAILYDPKTGKPKGAGFGDIYEKKFLVYPALQFPKKGAYKIQIEQSMRVDTLAGMVSIGLLLEKN